MKYPVCALLFVTLAASAQVSSHAPTSAVNAMPSKTAPQLSTPQMSDKPVAKVNSTVLTERDLVNEMLVIFPYAKVHGGFPKGQEAEIRRGALDMIIFEELVYQEAVRRGVTISPESVAHGEREFRKQFHSQAEFQQYLKSEAHGNIQVLRSKVKRALMIQAVERAEIDTKALMTTAQLRAYYDAHRTNYMHGDTYSIQSISILPPRNANPEQLAEARKRAEEAYRLAKATKSYQEFGMVAEKLSDDDFHVDMGDHKKPLEVSQTPPEVVAVLRNLQVGQVSNLIPMGPNYCIVRVVAHAQAGVTKFEDVKKQLRDDQQKTRTTQLRTEFAKKLKKNAKIEIL
jgi:parvulin-like peptidyl-prolyl isomerase